MSANAKQIKVTPVHGIPTLHVLEVWPNVEKMLQRAVRPETGHTIDSVLLDLQLGQMHLWVIGDYDGVAVTRIEDRPTGKVAWIQFLAGDNMKAWFESWLETVERYAREAECTAIEFAGRKGWQKLAQQYIEYKPMWTIFRRVL